MPMKLPEDVEQRVQLLCDPATPYHHIEHAGWLVVRLWESDDEFEVVAAPVMRRVAVEGVTKPRAPHQWRPKPG